MRQLTKKSAASVALTSQTRKRGFWGRVVDSLRKEWQVYLLILPGLLYVLIFNYGPMYGIQIAFKDFTPSKGFANSEWIGLHHFIRLFTGYQFGTIMKNTIVIGVYSLVAGFFPPIILAILLHNTTNKWFKSVVQTVSYAPHFISVVVLVGMINLMFSPRSGVFNTMIAALGGQKINFLAEASLFPHIYVWSGIWQNVGWSSIIYLAALSGANPELYDAARVDGANKFKRILHLDIPLMTPTIVTMLILDCGHILGASTQKVLLLQNPMNISTSQIIGTYVYEAGLINQQYGFSTATGLFQTVINLIMIVTVNRISRKVSENSLW